MRTVELTAGEIATWLGRVQALAAPGLHRKPCPGASRYAEACDCTLNDAGDVLILSMSNGKAVRIFDVIPAEATSNAQAAAALESFVATVKLPIVHFSQFQRQRDIVAELKPAERLTVHNNTARWRSV